MAVTDVTSLGASVLAACEARGHRAEQIQTAAGTAVTQLSERRPGSVATLARLALVLAAGGLPLDTPGALLVCAVADGACVDLDLSSGRDHSHVRIAVWPCDRQERNCIKLRNKNCMEMCQQVHNPWH